MLARRTLLALAPSVVAGRVWAAPKADARLLVVFLRGAYDAANVVIPTGSDFYYQARPTLAVPRPSSGAERPSLALDADWSLHPSLKESILPLWARGRISFVPFAGTDDLTRSHFETQDSIEMGQDVHGARDYRSGFMSRLAATLTRVRPISFTDQLPLVFHGPTPIPNIGLGAVGKPAVDERQAALVASMYQGTKLEAAVRQGFQTRDDVYRSIAEEQAANRGAISAKGFELSARRIGRLMRDQFNLGFVDVGGWDTHVNQGGASGYLSDRMGELGRAIAGFVEEIGPAWDDTVVVVISEFGRTFRENGDRGTDHGHGSTYWVLGGPVQGGRIAGPQQRVAETTLFQNRDFPVLTDYRALLGGLMRKLYGLTPDQLAHVFPSATPADLALV